MEKEKDSDRLLPDDKKVQLYLKQKKLLEDFLERGAITKAQFDKSFGDLTEKMGMQAYAGKGNKKCTEQF